MSKEVEAFSAASEQRAEIPSEAREPDTKKQGVHE
jgi:hypothetical protein